MFKVFLLFFLRFISHSFLFFVFPSMKWVFLAFLVHKTVCNLPSKDFHMQTARRGRGLRGIPFDFVFVSWLMRYNFHAVKKAFSVCYYKKKNNNNNMRKNNYNLCAFFYTSLPPSPFPCPLFCLSLSVFFARRGPPWLLSAAIWMSKINGQTFTFLFFLSLLFLLLLLLLLC